MAAIAAATCAGNVLPLCEAPTPILPRLLAHSVGVYVCDDGQVHPFARLLVGSPSPPKGQGLVCLCGE